MHTPAHFHRTMVVLALAALAPLAPRLAAAADAQPPNIVLIMADDQGWGDTAYNGHPLLKTPHLDAMAKAGLRFDRFYAAAPVCSPTRVSVLTGRHPNRMGAFSWGHSLRPQEITIAEALKPAGYVSGHFGKWHVGSVRAGSPVNPGASGFDRWLSAENFYDNDPILSREGKAVQLKGESSDIAAAAAIEFMKQQKTAGKPFLAVIWFGSPHVPHQAAAEDRAHYDGKKNADWLGEITGLDRAVGKVRTALRTLGVHENTLVWYSSDNGGLMPASSGGRGKKGAIYEGGLRVPAIIEWPSRIKTPGSSKLVACTSDIYPTLLAITGAKPAHQPPLDGISLVPLFDGEMKERPKPIGFWAHPTPGIGTPSAKWMAELLKAQAAGDEEVIKQRLRLEAGDINKQHPLDAFPGHAGWLDGQWKLHRIEPKGKPVKYELYDLAADPMEAKDRSDQEPQRVKAMMAQLEAWQKSVVASLNGADYPAASR